MGLSKAAGSQGLALMHQAPLGLCFSFDGEDVTLVVGSSYFVASFLFLSKEPFPLVR